MVVFVAKNLPVDNSDLYELNGYKPLSSSTLAAFGRESKYKNGNLSVKVTEGGALKYKINKIETSQKGADKLFKGDNWEPKLFKGDDTIKGSTTADALYGFDGNDTISGRGDDDEIDGGKGNDLIDGDTGINSATGGAGKDTFLFDAALVAGNGTIITDFKRGSDHIELDRDVFAGIGNKGVIYDIASGTLGYTKTGGPIGNAVEFGAATAGLALSGKDFSIV